MSRLSSLVPVLLSTLAVSSLALASPPDFSREKLESFFDGLITTQPSEKGIAPARTATPSPPSRT